MEIAEHEFTRDSSSLRIGYGASVPPIPGRVGGSKMMRNVNQWCGVLALVAVGCLVAFGSAGERVVTAANGQLSQAGDTGTAIAVGGCNRCAWSFKQINVANVQPGSDIVIFPRGTSGVLRTNTFFPCECTDWAVHADCLEAGATGLWTSQPRISNQEYDRDSLGIRFVDGLIVRYQGNPSSITLSLEYRLD